MKFLVHQRMMLGAVIGPVASVFGPVVPKLTLFLVSEPVETYVHEFGVIGNDGVVCDPTSGGVVGSER